MDLIKSISIENFVARRDGAVARLGALFAAVEAHAQVLSDIHSITLERLLGSHRDCRLFEGQAGLTAAVAEMDATLWQRLLLESGMRSFMASGDRAKWDANIHEAKVPELTLDNVRSTFAELYAKRGEMFADGVVAVFRGLSWCHKTNSPVAFGKKVILPNLWVDKGAYLSNRTCDLLDDLLRAMHVLDGKPEPDVRHSMYVRVYATDRTLNLDVLEDPYFTLKFYKKAGTAHATFKRQDLVDKMNMVLGSRFPDALATDIRNPQNQPKAAPVPGLRSISHAALEALRALRPDGNVLVGLPQLDRAVYDEVNLVLASLGGCWSRGDKGHVFAGAKPENMKYLLSRILRERAYAEPKDFGFFPTPEVVVEQMLALAKVEAGMRVLEPSAGRGAIVGALLSRGCRVRAIELMDANCDALRNLGCSVSQADFLEVRVSAETSEEAFDRIILNPPFAKHQDIAHVMHAMHFLKPGGRLVAVMAAGVKFNSDKYSQHFRQYLDEYGELIDLPAGAFKESGTDVSTVLVVIDKPDPARQLNSSAQQHSAAQQEPLALA